MIVPNQKKLTHKNTFRFTLYDNLKIHGGSSMVLFSSSFDSGNCLRIEQESNYKASSTYSKLIFVVRYMNGS